MPEPGTLPSQVGNTFSVSTLYPVSHDDKLMQRGRPGNTVVDDLVSESSEFLEKRAMQRWGFGGGPPQSRSQVTEQQRAHDRRQTIYTGTPCAYSDVLAVDLLSLLGEAAMRPDKGFEPLPLAVPIGHEEQHPRGVRRDNRGNLLGNLTLFVRAATEYDQIGHTGPRHRCARLRRFSIMPEAGEFCLDRGEIDRLRGERIPY